MFNLSQAVNSILEGDSPQLACQFNEGKATYRVTFHRGQSDKDKIHFDVEADSSDEAFQLAYSMCKTKLRDDPYHVYSDATTELVPTEPTNIGIHYRYSDGKQTYSDYLIIHADSEEDARKYYLNHFKGNHFDHWKAGELNPDGKSIYGDIIDSYFAACLGFDVDSTKEK